MSEEPNDPIAKVQALVGCVHMWRPDVGTKAGVLYRCNECNDTAEWVPGGVLPDLAPDCSTTDGALQAAAQLEVKVVVKTFPHEKIWIEGNGIRRITLTERERATAVCELILQARER